MLGIRIPILVRLGIAFILGCGFAVLAAQMPGIMVIASAALALICLGLAFLCYTLAWGLARSLRLLTRQRATAADLARHGWRYLLWFAGHHSVWASAFLLLAVAILALAGTGRLALTIVGGLFTVTLVALFELIALLAYLFTRRAPELAICWVEELERGPAWLGGWFAAALSLHERHTQLLEQSVRAATADAATLRIKPSFARRVTQLRGSGITGDHERLIEFAPSTWTRFRPEMMVRGAAFSVPLLLAIIMITFLPLPSGGSSFIPSPFAQRPGLPSDQGQPQPGDQGQPQPGDQGQSGNLGQPQPSNLDQQGQEQQGQPQPGDQGQPGGQGQPQPGDQGQPQPGDQGQPQPNAQGQPQPGDQGQPGGQGQPQPNGQGQPQPGDQGQPQPGDQGQPQPNAQGQPQPGDQGQPQPGDQGQPGGQGQPQPNAQGQPQPGDQGQSGEGQPGQGGSGSGDTGSSEGTGAIPPKGAGAAITRDNNGVIRRTTGGTTTSIPLEIPSIRANNAPPPPSSSRSSTRPAPQEGQATGEAPTSSQAAEESGGEPTHTSLTQYVPNWIWTLFP